MSHVFLSYARADQNRARAMASALEGLGHTVWWDHDIRAGNDFGKAAQEAIDHAAWFLPATLY